MIASALQLLNPVSEITQTSIPATRVHIFARVTVFFAAAGFGKTYAMADACERLQREGASVAWLPCAALALPTGDFSHGIRHFFELFEATETVFIDDLEVLSPVQRTALMKAFVLTAPTRKVVLSTRSLNDLGLTRLLADGAVDLIDADKLRWRRRQLAELWKGRLSTRQINYVDGIAQGWPAVSQLLARLVIKGGDPLSETMLLNASLASDYIQTEVLTAFDANELTVLSMTSVVEHFNNDFINRIGGKSTLTCEALVRRLPGLCEYQGGQAIVNYNRALSLHLKQMFASLPGGTRLKTLRRAADWASSQGDLVSAGNLAALAGDRQRIIEYVTRAGGMRIHLIKGLDDVRAIVTAAGEALVAIEPRLKLLKCFLLLKDGKVREAMHLYQEAAQSLPADEETQRGADYVRVSLMVYGCHLATMNGNEVELAARSLKQDPVYRETAPTILAMMHSQHADFKAATAAIAIARAYGRETGVTFNEMYLDVHSALVALACGKLDDARTHLSKGRRRWRTEFSNDTGAETVMLSVGTLLAFERGNIRQVRQLIAQVGQRLVRSEAWLDIYFAVYEPMFRLLARDHGLANSLAAIERSKQQLQDEGLDRIAVGLGNIGICLAGEYILQGDVSLSLSNDNEGPSALLESWQEKELRVLASAYTALANQRPRDAIVELTSLIGFSEQRGLLRTKLRALLVRQVANDRLHKLKAAAIDFQAALEIGALTGMRQAFFEFGVNTVRERIVAGVPGRFSDFAESLGGILTMSPSIRPDNALTRREKQVLEVLTGGASDKAIARQLHVTEYAVRFHLKNIYRKLGVHDRYSAVRHNSYP